jgi:hypothetical protein
VKHDGAVQRLHSGALLRGSDLRMANKPGPHRRPAAKHDAAPETFPDPPSTLIAAVRGRKTRVLFASRMGIWNPAGRGPSCGEWRALLSVSSWCVVRLYGPGKACMRRVGASLHVPVGAAVLRPVCDGEPLTSPQLGQPPDSPFTASALTPCAAAADQNVGEKQANDVPSGHV